MSARLFDELRLKGKAWPGIMESPSLLIKSMAAIKATHPDWDDGTMDMFHLETLFAIDLVKTGEVVYDLSHSLAALFSLTSSPEVDWSFVPHEAFVIKVPRSFLPMHGTIEPEYSYIYANRDRAIAVADWDTTARVAVAYGGMIGADYERVMRDPRLLRERTQRHIDVLDDPSIPLDLVDPPEWMNGLPEGQASKLARAALRQLATMAMRSIDLRTGDTVGISILVARLVANTVAYVVSHPPAANGRSKSNGTTTFALGPPHDVVVDRAFRDAARDVVAAISAGSIIGIRRALAHHVRGHWINQAVGAGHGERRATWIKPHKRGDESLGSVVRRIEHLGNTLSNKADRT